MRALIWKELRQQIAPLVVMLVLSTVLWFEMGSVWEHLVRSVSEGSLLLLLLPLVYAFVLAQLQFGRDGDERRFGQLVHRGGGARSYFRSKLVVGLACLAAVVALPMTVWALVMQASDPDALLIRWARLPQIFLLGVPALLVYATGVLATQLRRGAVLRWTLAACGVFGSFLVAFPFAALFDAGRIWPYTWVLLDAGVAAFVLALARGLLLAGRDRDLGLRDRHLAGVALVLLVLVLPFASFLFGSAESAALGTIVAAKPAILFDPRKGEIFAAGETQDGWRQLEVREGRIAGATAREISSEHGYVFFERQGDELEFLHYAGASLVEGEDRAREVLDGYAHWKSISDSAPRRTRSGEPASIAVAAAEKRQPVLGEKWSVQFEIDEGEGCVRVDCSRSAEGLPPWRARVTRPDGRFSAQAHFLESATHRPLVLDRADGTLWRIELEPEGASAVPLELPGGDRVSALAPLYRRAPVELGRFAPQWTNHSVEGQTAGFLLVGRAGTYTMTDGRIAPLSDVARPKDSVTAEEAGKLARYSVSASWSDAFTEEIRVERRDDQRTVLAVSTGADSGAARTAARIYGALAFLRAPGGVLAESLWGWSSHTGHASAPFAVERRLFDGGRHPLLLGLVLFSAAMQVLLGWRWLARGGASLGTRAVLAILILAGGVVALFFTWLLLPRSAIPRPAIERVRTPAPAAAHA